MQKNLHMDKVTKKIDFSQLELAQNAMEGARGLFLSALYYYRFHKSYKRDGFGSFAAAYSALTRQARRPLKISTIRKYFMIIDACVNNQEIDETLFDEKISVMIEEYRNRKKVQRTPTVGKTIKSMDPEEA